jgi:nucleoside-diphosphate-sugar epimerase
MKKVLLTGASGFLGGQVINRLVYSDKYHPLALVRNVLDHLPPFLQREIGSFLDNDTDLSEILYGQDTVIHCAARAHVFKCESGDPYLAYRRINVDGTLMLARQAAEAGVRRFIFISSIGVNGNISARPFKADDASNPAEPYARSKWEAEQGLWQIQSETGIEVVIIRPPLVYGFGAPGNFGSLVHWIKKGVPLPLGAVHNRRSLVGIDNLVDLIIHCIDHPAAANQVFLAADGEDLSTTELLRCVGEAMGHPARLIPIPVGMLRFGAILIGKKAIAQRLLGSLQVDISKTCRLLNWEPPYSVQEGLRRCFERSD